jgi:hypothetical protein
MKQIKRIKTGSWFISRLIAAVLCISSPIWIAAQTNQLETDKGIAASIAPYDAGVRQAILQASQYPQVLTELQKKQGETVTAFQNKISIYRQTKQGWFYTLTRYPSLLHTLATLPKNQDKESVYKLLPNQDPALQKAAWRLYRHNKKGLEKIDNMQIAAQQDFEKTIQNLNPSAKAAFEKLATMPDVLTLLTNNIDLTTRLGEHYKSDPEELSSRLTAIHDSLNVQDQYETAALKKQMADDPQAQQELAQAAKDYANQYGYDMPTQQDYDMNNGNYYANPYSYWFGYPLWYSYPLWYPGFYGFGPGFYLGLGGFGLYGFPSYGFSYWFYNRGYYRRYPHLYNQFGNYYHRNMEEHRVMGGVNHGFMRAADNHYNPRAGNRMNQLTTPTTYHRSAVGQTSSNTGNAGHINANTYHSQSWDAYGGRSNSIGRSSFGGGGGGFHGGGGRR